jgi:hypothetical protein
MVKVLFPGGATFSTLNALVAQLEAADGPLTEMVIDGRTTTMTFDEDVPKQPVPAVIQPSDAAAPPGATRVCAGRIVVAGEPRDCTAYRAKRTPG